MPDTLMLSRLENEELYQNTGLIRMLWEEENKVRQTQGEPVAGIEDMAALNNAGVSVEHILPQDPAFIINNYGFAEDEFDEYKHRLGNLLLLETSLNSACKNKTVEEKVTASKLYSSLKLFAVKKLIADRVGEPQGYLKENIEQRSRELGEMLLSCWPIDEQSQL